MQNENENKHDFELPEVADKQVRVHKSPDVCTACEG